MGRDFSCEILRDKFPGTRGSPESKALEGTTRALKLSDIEKVIPSFRIV